MLKWVEWNDEPERTIGWKIEHACAKSAIVLFNDLAFLVIKS